MLKFNIALFEQNLCQHDHESAKRQIHEILIADSEKAEKICAVALKYQSGQVALAILQHKIFPYCLSPETLKALAKMNLMCAESFSENSKLLEKTGYDFILPLIHRYPSLYKISAKYWGHYSYDVLRELTKGNLQLLSHYFDWVSELESIKQAKHKRSILQLFRDIERREIAVSLNNCPRILSIAVTTLPDDLTLDWERELCVWITKYHIEILEFPALLKLFKMHPISSQSAFSNRFCIAILANRREGAEKERQLNWNLQNCAVFSMEPLVILNLFTSPLRRYLTSETVNKLGSAFREHLTMPKNPKVDFLFLLNVLVFMEQLSSNTMTLKKKQSAEDFRMHDQTLPRDFQPVSGFTSADLRELNYLQRVLHHLTRAFQIRCKTADVSLQVFSQSIAKEMSFEKRENILSQIETAYFQAEHQKDPRRVQYEQIYNWIRKIHAKDVYEQLRPLIPDCILSDEEVLKRHQADFLLLCANSPLVPLVHRFNRLDLLSVIVSRSFSAAPDEIKPALSGLLLQLEKDLILSSEKRKRIHDSLVFLVKADPRNYCNEALRLCYLLYAEHGWPAKYIDALWIHFFPERLNHALLDGCGHFYFAKILIVGEEKREIIPLQFCQKMLVTVGFSKSWQYINPWYRMLEVAISHLMHTDVKRYVGYEPDLVIQAQRKLTSMPQYLDLEAGEALHQSLVKEVETHFQQYPEIHAHRRSAPHAPIQTVAQPASSHEEAHALGFSVIEVPKKAVPPSSRAKAHTTIQTKTATKQLGPSPLIPKPMAPPPEIIPDTSDDLMEMAEHAICEHTAQVAERLDESLMALLKKPAETARVEEEKSALLSLPPPMLDQFLREQSLSDTVKPSEQEAEEEDLDFEALALAMDEDGEFFCTPVPQNFS